MSPIRIPSAGIALWSLLLALTSASIACAEITPFKIERNTELRFPLGLIADAVTHGEVWIMVSIDADGKLSDALPTRYTHRAMANEALDAVRAWRYQPARQDGRPISSRAELYFKFEASGAVITMDASTTVRSLSSFAEKPVYIMALCHPADLDHAPTAIRVVSPSAPVQASQLSASNMAVIDFIIDESGRPRMPVLVSSPSPEYAAEAARALAQWQFSPPMRNGKPVAVQARQEFVFPNRS